MSKITLRATRIVIDNARPGEPNWVSANIQKVEVDDDGKVISEEIAKRSIFRRIDRGMAIEEHTFVDPTSGKEMTLNVAQIAAAVRKAVINWELETFDSHYDHETDSVVLNDTD